jgi:hypothetical protein
MDTPEAHRIAEALERIAAALETPKPAHSPRCTCEDCFRTVMHIQSHLVGADEYMLIAKSSTPGVEPSAGVVRNVGR